MREHSSGHCVRDFAIIPSVDPSRERRGCVKACNQQDVHQEGPELRKPLKPLDLVVSPAKAGDQWRQDDGMA